MSSSSKLVIATLPLDAFWFHQGEKTAEAWIKRLRGKADVVIVSMPAGGLKLPHKFLPKDDPVREEAKKQGERGADQFLVDYDENRTNAPKWFNAVTDGVVIDRTGVEDFVMMEEFQPSAKGIVSGVAVFVLNGRGSGAVGLANEFVWTWSPNGQTALSVSAGASGAKRPTANHPAVHVPVFTDRGSHVPDEWGYPGKDVYAPWPNELVERTRGDTSWLERLKGTSYADVYAKNRYDTPGIQIVRSSDGKFHTSVRSIPSMRLDDTSNVYAQLVEVSYDQKGFDDLIAVQFERAFLKARSGVVEKSRPPPSAALVGGEVKMDVKNAFEHFGKQGSDEVLAELDRYRDWLWERWVNERLDPTMGAEPALDRALKELGGIGLRLVDPGKVDAGTARFGFAMTPPMYDIRNSQKLSVQYPGLVPHDPADKTLMFEGSMPEALMLVYDLFPGLPVVSVDTERGRGHELDPEESRARHSALVRRAFAMGGGGAVVVSVVGASEGNPEFDRRLEADLLGAAQTVMDSKEQVYFMGVYEDAAATRALDPAIKRRFLRRIRSVFPLDTQSVGGLVKTALAFAELEDVKDGSGLPDLVGRVQGIARGALDDVHRTFEQLSRRVQERRQQPRSYVDLVGLLN
jgi:hypothetical protein